MQSSTDHRTHADSGHGEADGGTRQHAGSNRHTRTDRVTLADSDSDGSRYRNT
ncbi:MAG: hypothetical protein AB1566_12820 [Chloroflexota bacterium]